MKYLASRIERRQGDMVWITTMRNKFLKCWKIKNGYDFPTPPPMITETLIRQLEDVVKNDEGQHKVDWHEAAAIISDHIQFASPLDTGEFLYYDTADGTWKPGAAELIDHILRKAYPGLASRYMKEETSAHIIGTHYYQGDFGQKEDGVYINCMNGVIDAMGGKFLPHGPEYRFRYVLPIEYDPFARPERILLFLSQVAEDDLNKALKILESFAYCFIPGYPIQKAITFIGKGNNGKSITLSILSALLGKKNIASIPLQTITNSRFAATELRNKLANISGDVSEGALKDTSIFKQLTGGDYINSEIKMVQKRPQFINRAKLIYGFNQLPKSNDQTMAFYRRFEMIKFIQDFRGREDRQLIGKLTTARELSGLLNILARVFIPALVAKQEFHESQDVEELQIDYNLSANPALAFIHEHVEVEPDGQILIETLYQKFVAWAKERGLNIAAPESFGYTVRNLSGILVQKRKIQEEGVRKEYYTGIRYIDEIPVITEENKKCHTFIKTPETIEEAVNLYIDAYLKDFNNSKSGIGGIGYLSLYMNGGYISKINNNAIHVKDSKSYDTYATDDINIPPEEIKNKHTFTSSGSSSKFLADMGITVLACENIQGMKWKVQTVGYFEKYTEEQQAKIMERYDVVFRGSPSGPHTWLHFSVLEDPASYVLMKIEKDLDVAWYDRDWHFHRQDIVHVPEPLGKMLVERGIGHVIRTEVQ